jgi:hypothetical protein
MPDPADRQQKVVRRVLVAVDKVLTAAEELRAANAALSLEASRPELRIRDEQKEVEADHNDV